MARARGRTRPCSKATIEGRRAKAEEFWSTACETDALHPDGRSDAVIQMCILAGIAASDVICCVRLGEHVDDQSHNAAIDLLSKINPKLAAQLRALLSQKTESGYRERRSTGANRRAAMRAAGALVEAARIAV